MKVRRSLLHIRVAAALCLVLSSPLLFSAKGKPIHLRNQIIAAKPAAAARAGSASPLATRAPASGLFLVQFAEAPSAEARAQLNSLGVDLLHYVPEDTFIARLHSVNLDQLRAQPGVLWVGEYRPEYKVHASLQGEAAKEGSSGSMSVAVLVVPRAAGAEIGTLRRSFRSVQQESTLRIGTILRGEINAGTLNALANSELVLWIESARKMKLFDEVSSKIVAGDGGANVLLAQSLGFDGSGVNVAVADSGLNNGDAASMHPDLFGRTPSFFYYGSLTGAEDEHSHGTHVSGIIAGNGATGETDDNGALYGLGVAPGANIIAQRIFDGVGTYEPPPSYERLTRDAKRAGADIGSNSWGDDTQGRYDISAMEFDALVRDADALALGDQQYILEFSAGNAGPGSQTIGSPAVAKNVIATGASESAREDFVIYGDGPEVMADFSSRGPCEDGRIKPDVIAPGTWISSLQSASASDQYAWAGIDDLYQYQGGTSQAGPHASGAAAVFVQYYRQTHTNATPSPALVKATLINSAVELDETFGNDPVPNNDQGWGRIDLTPLFDSTLTFRFLDQTVLLTNNQIYEQHVIVAGHDEPFKITLAYTDVPGFPGAIPALVNNVELEVIAPDGRLYRGNQFDTGESIPNPPAFDALNNVKGISLSSPQAGDYIVRVRGRNIVQDAREETAAVDQDFALVVSGQLAAPGIGAVILDRAAYTAPSRIKITVIDTDQAGQPSVTVKAQSTTEAPAETLQLLASGSSGAFTGSIATATGPAVANGKLEIAANDAITISYVDVSASATRIATARADLTAPVLSGVVITNGYGQATISWNTDEPATSVVRYGTNATLGAMTYAVTNTDLDTSHSISVSGLVAGRTYYCYLTSTDEAGNTGTNNNAGAFYVIVVPPTATLLLVDEYTDPYFGPPPLSGYTDALNQVGLSYDTWIVANQGAPTLNTLKPYKAIVWRVPELSGAWTTAERSAISNYLNSGGAMFVASMEILSRLEEVSAVDFIHNVLQVRSYVVDPNSTGAEEIIGAPYETVGSGIDISMDYSMYYDLWSGFIDPADIADTIIPSTNATAVLHNDAGDIVGIRWPGIGQQAPGRLVFLSTVLDAAPMASGVNDRVNLLRNALNFLVPGAGGQGAVSFDTPAYTLPSLVTVQVGDSDLAGQGTLNVTVSSSTQTNGLSLTLYETTDAGVFSGAFTLISSTNPPTAGKIRGANGDTLIAKYFDASVNSYVTAIAMVDTVKPVITGVSADPDYIQATIYWNTSKDSDALVEFGESPLLGRTGYDPSFLTSHAVDVQGLVPDRTYYYRVTSRDIAGNSIVDDNKGKLYTFHTLLPIIPPWFDNMDLGATNWSVITSDYSEAAWTLGRPDNGLVGAAHSRPNAWGTNLKGVNSSLVESFLVSPAIYLTNGNSATLTFWHAYDFTASAGGNSIEEADVQIVASDSSSTTTIASFTDASFGWEKAEIDLSAYAGQVIYIAWYYLLIDFDNAVHPGWLVDDVSVTVTNILGGTVTISNNIWQAGYVLSGGSFLNGKGLGTVITNVPAGQYVLEFADVPYYITPASQTNALVPGGTLAFQGVYTFPDTNHNGISDLWEQARFGNVSTNRTNLTDTDHDGMTDYQEFLAGTDPNNPVPPFKLTAQLVSNNIVRLQWPLAPREQVRLRSSTNMTSWTLYTTNWLQTNRLDVPLSTVGPRTFFRAEASVINSPTNLPPYLKLTTQRQTNGTVTLSWLTSPGRGYLLQSSTNFVNWTPIYGWNRAGSAPSSMSYNVPTSGARSMFRVVVQP